MNFVRHLLFSSLLTHEFVISCIMYYHILSLTYIQKLYKIVKPLVYFLPFLEVKGVYNHYVKTQFRAVFKKTQTYDAVNQLNETD